MLNNRNTNLLRLYRLGLDTDQAKVYLALLEKPMSHLEIARKTSVNRTKVYRIADDLIKRGLIAENQDETGRQLIANDPANLEISIKTDEEEVERKKQTLQSALPGLQTLFASGSLPGESDFEVNTYEGSDGFKQMLWNELKTKDEIVIFGSGTIADLVGSRRWAEKHREKTIESGYKIREVLNPNGKPNVFTENENFMQQYNRRYVPVNILPLTHQLCVYNNTVAIYSWVNDQKVGVEIVNKQFAEMQRSIFEEYWRRAK